MARIARIVVPNMPHHVTQRGNRSQQTFFSDKDYHLYLGLMSEWCTKSGVEIWAYCLMPNHVHLIAVPSTTEGLARAIGEAHRRYSWQINQRNNWRGYLWQGRFASFVMDEAHLLAAARYIELNPIRAHLVRKPGDYRWSSARAHLAGKEDPLVHTEPLLELAGPWDQFLASALQNEQLESVRRHEHTGRPLGDEKFIGRLELRLGHNLTPGKRGPKLNR